MRFLFAVLLGAWAHQPEEALQMLQFGTQKKHRSNKSKVDGNVEMSVSGLAEVDESLGVKSMMNLTGVQDEKLLNNKKCQASYQLRDFKADTVEGCREACENLADCVFYAHWTTKSQSVQLRCVLYSACPTKVDIWKNNRNKLYLIQRPPGTTTTTPPTTTTTPPTTTTTPPTTTTTPPTTTTTPPTTTTTPPTTTTTPPTEEGCDPEWRKPDDEQGGNICEMRQKIAELPPAEAPLRAEPDARAAAHAPPTTHNLKFDNLINNDLFGSGMRFAGVTMFLDRSVDAIVTAQQGYAAAVPSKNGLKGKLGNINLDSNTEATFTMAFVDGETDAVVELGEFFFSIFDIDTGDPEVLHAIETLTISGWHEYYLMPQMKGGQIVVQHLGHGSASFTGSDHGNENDNPTDPLVLSDEQNLRTVSFKFAPGTHSVTWTYKVTETYKDGRNFQFGGMTQLYFCQAEKVNIDLSWARVVRSNLGHQGPQFDEPEGVLYHRIATIGHQVIDMEINALTPYRCLNCSKNGKNGMFGQVNMMAGLHEPHASSHNTQPFDGESEFQFSLYKGGTKDPWTAEWLYWSVFDLDNAKPNKQWNPKWQESFTVSDFSTFMTSTDTEIVTEKLGPNLYRFNSTKKGTGKDNPEDPLNLHPVALKRAISLVYRNTNTWTSKFQIGGPYDQKDGRNFLFAGKSSTVTCDLNTAEDVVNVPAAMAAEVVDPDIDAVVEAEQKLKDLGVEVD